MEYAGPACRFKGGARLSRNGRRLIRWLPAFTQDAVKVPDSVVELGEDSFAGLTGLTAVELPAGLKTIGERAFKLCTGLAGVTIPDSVTSIGAGAFAGCSGLTSVTIGTGLTSISYQMFCNCSGLASVTIPAIELAKKDLATPGNLSDFEVTSIEEADDPDYEDGSYEDEEDEEREPSFSFPLTASATGLRSALPVRAAPTGRPFRTRATTTTARGTSTSIRAYKTRPTTTPATAGSLFVLSKVSPNSEQSKRIEFFNPFAVSPKCANSDVWGTPIGIGRLWAADPAWTGVDPRTWRA